MKHTRELQTNESQFEWGKKWNTLCNGKEMNYKCYRKQTMNSMQLQTNEAHYANAKNKVHYTNAKNVPHQTIANKRKLYQLKLMEKTMQAQKKWSTLRNCK